MSKVDIKAIEKEEVVEDIIEVEEKPKKSTKGKSTKGKSTKGTKAKRGKKEGSEKRKLLQAVRKKASDIDVEIQNIYFGKVGYFDYKGHPYFQLAPGQTKMISLEELYEVANDCVGLFKNYKIIIIDVYDDEYTVGDILQYLGIEQYYENPNGLEEDYIDTLLEDDTDYEDFEDIVGRDNQALNKAIAGRMISKIKSEDYYDRDKIDLIARKMKLRTIIKEIRDLDSEDDE